MFKIKGCILERMMTRYITTLADDLVQKFVYDLDSKYSLGKLVKKNKIF